MHNIVKVVIVAVALSVAGSAHADVLRVIEGPRQQADKANCPAYRPIWTEFTRTVPGVGVFEFGPESPLPNGSADDVYTPEEELAYTLWGTRAKLHVHYVDTRDIANIWTGAPLIGYDQFYAAFAIAAETTPGQRGVRIDPPRLTDYPHNPADYSSYDEYRIASMVYQLSWPRQLSLDQLARIHAVLVQVPTCGGVAY